LSRGEARRRAFLTAAWEVFLDQGFEAASVNEIVRRAGGSLATLYQQFGSKEHLFIAAVEDRVDQLVTPMVSTVASSVPLETGLQQMGETFLNSLLSPSGVAFFRVAIGEARKFPEPMRKFLLIGPDRVRAVVASYLVARSDIDNGVRVSERGGGLFLRDGAWPPSIPRDRRQRLCADGSRDQRSRGAGREVLPARSAQGLSRGTSPSIASGERARYRRA